MDKLSGINNFQHDEYTFNSVGTQSVKIIGQAADVRVDKVLFMGTAEQCASMDLYLVATELTATPLP